MSVFRLLLKNLLFHRRGNLAVFLGVALGTAVLTGALLVGDSLRGSLRELTLDQLGWVHYAMTPNRFFREELADGFPTVAQNDELSLHTIAPSSASPVLLLQGSAIKVVEKGGSKSGPVNNIAVYGVTDRFWPESQVPVSREFWREPRSLDGASDSVVLNDALAQALNVMAGDTISIRLQKPDAVSRETLLGKRRQEDVIQAIEVKVHAVLPDRGMARFTLQPSPEPVRNAFLPLHFLQGQLGLADRANVLLANAYLLTEDGHRAVANWNADIVRHLWLDDWNLKLRSPTDRARALVHFLDPRSKDGNLKRIVGAGGWLGRVPDELAEKADKETKILAGKDIVEFYRQHHNYFLLESRQLLLDDAVVQAVKKAYGVDRGKIEIGTERWWLCPTFIYLADSIAQSGGSRPPLAKDASEISYAVIAAQGALPGDKEPPQKDQIDVADWPGSPFSVKPGDPITVTYYAPDDHNHLQKLSATFTVRKLFPLTGDYDDPDLVPQFPGITDKLDMEDWNPNTVPFPYDPQRGKLGEKYWKRYRTTPRAYISLEKAQELWGSRFGNITSYRVIPMQEPKDFSASMKAFGDDVLKSLDPKAGGFVWQDVRKSGLQAGGGSADFGMFFLGFSFYLIVAALLLVGLLFRLNLDLRGREIGILLATGWTLAQVRRLLLREGGLLAILGGFVGLAGALLYADRLLKYLSDEWPGKLQFLRLHVTAESLAIGWAASVIVSFLTIVWAVRVLARMTPTRLLAGETTASASDLAWAASDVMSFLTILRVLARITPTRLLAGETTASATDLASGGRKLPDAPSGKSGGLRPPLAWSVVVGCVIFAGMCMVAGFFLQGHEAKAGSFLTSGMLLLVACLTVVWRWLKHTGGQSNPRQSLVGLAMRNAGRHAVRSVLTVGLLAAAIFLIVAVEAFHKDTSRDFLEETGGSGGFALFAQADVPIFQDLNDPTVRHELPGLDKAGPEPLKATFFPCRLQAGDDASCLNLYQAKRPRILGVPRSLIQRGGFSFAATAAKTPEEEEKPWLLLEAPKAADGTIPVFVDATTAQWTLGGKGLSDIIDTVDEQNRPIKLRIVGLLSESIFQSELVMAESNFRRLFPRQEGFSFFLIEAPADPDGQWKSVRSAWENALADNGLTIQTTMSRVEKYLAVENTYLATFQALGKLGLLLGAVGLAIVLLRSVWERRAELALLRALGFTRRSLAWLVLAENILLLLVGLVVGTLSAILTVAPQIFGGAASFLGLRVLVLLGMVIAVGLIAGLAAVAATLRAPLLQALRHE